MLWSILNGTVVNAITVAAGSFTGLTLGPRLPERYRRIVLTALGLVTVLLGVDAGVLTMRQLVRDFGPAVHGPETYGARLGMVMIVCLLTGCILGTALRLNDRIDGLGRMIHARVGRGDGHRFAEGFLTASVIFCVGPLTLLGCLRNGAEGDPSYLYIKSALDGFSSIALAAAFGGGVVASVLTVIVLQGGLSLLAYWSAGSLPDVSVGMMNVVGGVMLLATALTMLEVKKIPVADMLPGLFLPPLLIPVCESLWPGYLLPGAA